MTLDDAAQQSGGMTQDRPRLGKLLHRDGTDTDVIFVETETPGSFEAQMPDGSAVYVRMGDRVLVDVIGPGQQVRFPMPDFAAQE